MQVSESQYKFNLSIDLIYFLVNILLRDSDNKIEMINLLMEKWSNRITENQRHLNVEESKKIAEEIDCEVDVASIILSAHQTEEKMLRNEFSDQLKKILINTFIQEIGGQELKK